MESSLLKAGFIFAVSLGFLLMNGNIRSGVKEIMKSKNKKVKKDFAPEKNGYC